MESLYICPYLLLEGYIYLYILFVYLLQYIHGENAGTLGMVPLRINPIYTLYSGYLLGISPLKGLLGGLNS